MSKLNECGSLDGTRLRCDGTVKGKQRERTMNGVGGLLFKLAMSWHSVPQPRPLIGQPRQARSERGKQRAGGGEGGQGGPAGGEGEGTQVVADHQGRG